MAQRLEAAYRATDYIVEAPEGAFTLHIDEPSAPLAALHAHRGAECSAFISAANPGSVRRAPAENATAHEHLLATLETHACDWIEGWGRDPAGIWLPERSVLVLALPLAAALDVARDFGQNAILHAAADAVPRLVWVSAADDQIR
jgi:hypothetical protein